MYFQNADPVICTIINQQPNREIYFSFLTNIEAKLYTHKQIIEENEVFVLKRSKLSPKYHTCTTLKLHRIVIINPAIQNEYEKMVNTIAIDLSNHHIEGQEYIITAPQPDYDQQREFRI